MTAAVAAMAPPRRPPANVRLGAEIAWTTLRVRRLVHRNDLPTVLARRGVAASLVMGVRREEELGARAWVEVGGVPAPPAAKDKFAQLVAL